MLSQVNLFLQITSTFMFYLIKQIILNLINRNVFDICTHVFYANSKA